MDQTTKIIVFTIITLVLIAILYRYMYKSEHMNPALLTHQVEDLSKKPNDSANINFYVRGNRFAADNKLCPNLQQILPTVEGIKCGPQLNWDTYALPGANNVYGDMIWTKVSPRMILEDNSMQCGNKAYNAPTGIPTTLHQNEKHDLSQNLNEFGTVGSLSDQHMMKSP